MSDPREGLRRLQAAAENGTLEELCRRHSVRILTVFGSTITEKPQPKDLDIAVAFEHGSSPDFLALMNQLMDLTGVDRVDLLDLNRAGPVAKERGLMDALPLYESRPFEFSAERVAAIQAMMETKPLRRLQLRLLANR